MTEAKLNKICHAVFQFTLTVLWGAILYRVLAKPDEYVSNFVLMGILALMYLSDIADKLKDK